MAEKHCRGRGWSEFSPAANLLRLYRLITFAGQRILFGAFTPPSPLRSCTR